MENRMKLKLVIIVFALTVIGLLQIPHGSPQPAYASNITTAKYYGTVLVSNNGIVASGVSVNCSINSQGLIDNEYVDEDFDNCAVRNGSGADVPFMPGVNATSPWCFWVPSIAADGNINYILYTGNSSLDSTKYYFPGDGGMNLGDPAALELSDNFTISLTDTRFDTSATDSILEKEDAIKVSPGSGNITATIYEALANPTGTSDPDTQWTDDANAIDGNDATYAYDATIGTQWSSYLYVTYTAKPIIEITTKSDLSGYPGESLNIDIWNMATGAWVEVYDAVGTGTLTHTLSSAITSNQIRVRIYNPDANPHDSLLYLVQIIPQASVSKSTTAGDHDATLQMDSHFLSLGVDTTGNITPVSDGLTMNAPLPQAECNAATFTTIDDNEFTATVTSATWTKQGYYFDGSGDYITIPDADALDFTGNSTLHQWAKLTATATAGQYPCLATKNNWRIQVLPGTTNVYLRAVVGAAIKAAPSGAGMPLTLDTWGLVTFVNDGTNITSYLNGVQYGSPVASGGGYDADVTDLYFGKSYSAAQYITGYLGDTTYYGSASTADEVLQYYNATKLKYTGAGDITTTSTLESVADNANAIHIGDDDATPYIGAVSWTVGGTLIDTWSWEYAETFTGAVSGITATPTFRATSSSANVSAEMVSFEPITTARAPDFAIDDQPDFITANITATSNFTSGSAPVGGPPGAAVVDAVAAGGGTPNIWVWGILVTFTLASAGLFISFMERRYGGGGGTLILRIGIASVVFGIFVAIEKFDFWMLVLYLIVVMAPAMASRHGEWGGNIGQLNMIGFLSQSFIGLTIINNILGGELLTGNERAWANYFAFTQTQDILGLFSLPVLNFEFFTHGIPSLLEWDTYTFFGGQAQLIAYLLYSLTAVVGFMILLVIIGLLYNTFSRFR
jgi:hypothetical protein